MSRWDELVQGYERSIVENRPNLAVQLLSELTLTAPASAVRRYHADLVKISRQCSDPRIREQLIVTLDLLRQRATITDSSLNVRSATPKTNRTPAGGPERLVRRPVKKERPASSRSRGTEGSKRGDGMRTPSPSGRNRRSE